MKLYMRNGSLGQAACCLGVAYSANYRKDKLPKYKERIGINVIFFPHYGRDRIEGHKST